MQIELPAKLEPVFIGPARYRCSYGGRGSGKSASFAKMLLLKGMEKKRKLLCAREFQNSIKDSVHAEMCKQVEEMGLHWFYDCQEKLIRGTNGTTIFYRGLWNNLGSIRSISDVDICWIDEAEYISDNSYNVLLPTIRNPDSEIWLTWNPERTDSPTKTRFLDNTPANARIAMLNWRDNPWFPRVLEDERLLLLARDPDRYQNVWEGQCMTRSDAQVFRGKWEVRPFTVQPHWDGPYDGADWGFSVDPTVRVRVWIGDGNLWIEREAWGMHVETRDVPRLFDTFPDSRKTKIWADAARPETISQIRNEGFLIEPAEKWPGSVEDGIEHIRGQYDRVVIHSQCPRTASEFGLYCYKVDKLTDEVTTDIIDKHNHCCDAIRYALSKMIQKRRKGFFDVPRR